ncbi:phage holin [Virgibacillus ndiopensis]|uniref:phage holin n=1 Tax=Virgibacillus ndiopensis TaxID=2004408 RepID=UPI000C08C18D|nr:phage holin [Virgibacillus ndiopensis]
MKINWKVRLKNKTFWLTIIPALLLVAQIVAGWFGIDFATEVFKQEAINFINAVFAVLVILGVVNDPTVAGTSDSKQARTYHKPRKDVA